MVEGNTDPQESITDLRLAGLQMAAGEAINHGLHEAHTPLFRRLNRNIQWKICYQRPDGSTLYLSEHDDGLNIRFSETRWRDSEAYELRDGHLYAVYEDFSELNDENATYVNGRITDYAFGDHAEVVAGFGSGMGGKHYSMRERRAQPGVFATILSSLNPR